MQNVGGAALLSAAAVIVSAGLGVGLGLASADAQAQGKPGPLLDTYPNHTVRMLVSSAAGGGLDITARGVAQKLTERTGQSVVVENRAGGNGVIAMDTLEQAPRDGYTMLASSNALLLNGVAGRVAYDVRKAFDVAVMMTTQPYVISIIPAPGVNGVKDLIAYARAHPGELNYGSGGVGSVNHLCFELLQAAAGISLTHIPYKGSAGVYPDLMSGRIQMICSSGVSMAPYIRSGKLKAVGVGSLRRTQAFPDIPTMAEQGLPGFEIGNSYYLYVPAGTPANLQAALNRAVNQITNAPDLKDKLTADGAEPGSQASPADLKKAFVAEFEMWDNLIRKNGIKLSD
jgi:tripartite-type tricarboxylate transporter receptor subunit TctC